MKAALRIYHGEEKSKRVYFHTQAHSDPVGLFRQMQERREQVQNMLHNARIQAVSKLGDQMGSVVDHDLRVASMPAVRVLQKPKRFKKQPPPPTLEHGNDGRKTLSKKGGSSLQVTQPAGSRINYAVLTAKAQKAAALEKTKQPPDPRTFLPGGTASFLPPHDGARFASEHISLR